MPFSLDGIEEKLKRTNEHIRNLETEVSRFFEDSEYPVFQEENKKIFLEAVEYHKKREVPPRFSVLVGEIVHHLRSILDHLVWQLSAPNKRSDRTEFPILKVRPIEKDALKRYKRKIEGISNPHVRGLIESLQPYNSPDPFDSPIWILHNMDVINKHRELVLCVSEGAFSVPVAAVEHVIAKHFPGYQSGIFDGRPLPSALSRELKSHGKIIATVSFRNFGRRENEPIVPAIVELNNFVVVEVLNRFAGLFPK